MKKIIIGVIFLIIVVGGGAAGMMMAGYGPFANKGNGEQAKAVVEVPPVTIDMGALSVPLILDNAPAVHAQILARLIVDADKEAYVRNLLPKLRDAYLRDFLSFLPVHMQSRKVPDPVDIHARMKVISDKILGSGMLRDIQVTDARIR